MRILLVEDHFDSAQLFTAILKKTGHEVRTVHSGRAGVLEAKSSNPEVIISDIGLPDLNGYELAKQVRAQEQFKTTLMIAITGYGQPEDVDQALAAGFDHHMLKPIDWDKLRRLLDAHTP